ncbi:MAG: hypothetical protein AAFN10_29295, partial [Bacteroidota bacterium]
MYEGLLKDPKWTSIWQEMFPHKPLPKDTKQIPHILRKRAHALKKLFKEYLACLDVAENPYDQDIAFLKHLKTAKIDNDFILYFRQAERAYDKRDGEYHEQLGLMLENLFEYEVRAKLKKPGQRLGERNEHFA